MSGDPYAVLGVAPDATDREIRDAWRDLALVYHPDRHLASPPGQREDAERRMREINAAFHSIRAQRAAAPRSHRPLAWRCVYCGHEDDVDLLNGKRWTCARCNVHVRHTLCPATGVRTEVYWWGHENVDRCAGCGRTHRKHAPLPYGECFVAGAVYRDREAPAVVALRTWRDEVLAPAPAGRALIAAYRVAGPRAATVLERVPALRPPLRRVLDRLSRAAAGATDRHRRARGGTRSG